MSENNQEHPVGNTIGQQPASGNSAFKQNAGAQNSTEADDYRNLPPEEDLLVSFKRWLIANNPFYLLSVFFMFWGLYLASVDGATGRGPESLKGLLIFYAVENIYELIMFAMAIYLLHKRVNQPHGRLLVFFIIIFLCDAAMYQSVIANSCAIDTLWIGAAVSALYFILAALKLGLLIHFLRIKICYEAVFYTLASLALLYFVPHFINYLVITNTSNYNVWWIFYYIMLVAALVQLPLIAAGWNKKYDDFVEERDNKFWGASELNFYKLIVIIPFVAVPVQILLNAASDLKSIDHTFSNFDYGFVPYLLFSVFFIQSVYKKLISSYFISLNSYDFTCTLVIFAAAVITKPIDISVFGDTALYPHRINIFLIIAANIVFFITRKNYMSVSFAAILGLYYTKSYYYGVIEYINSSSVTRAAAFITVSFIMLAAGFVLSLSGRAPAPVSLSSAGGGSVSDSGAPGGEIKKSGEDKNL
jgi:hypothetical protein